MRKINTEKMDRVTYNGQEIAFGRVQKNEWGEYVVKVYVDGVYDEDKTIYADSREDAEATKAIAIRDYTKHNVTLIDIAKYTDILDGEDEDLAAAKLVQELTALTDDELVTIGYQTYAMLENCQTGAWKIITINSVCADIIKAREEARR